MRDRVAVADDGNQNRQNVGHLHGTRPAAMGAGQHPQVGQDHKSATQPNTACDMIKTRQLGGFRPNPRVQGPQESETCL